MMLERNDLVLCSAKVITMNPRQAQAEALAVCNRRIVAVGAWTCVAFLLLNMAVSAPPWELIINRDVLERKVPCLYNLI